MSERYVPPPPSYQHSIQHDQRVTEEDVHALEPSKTSLSRDKEWNDAKYSMALAVKDAMLHSISKHPVKLDGASFRARPRPLPSRPTDPSVVQEQGYRLDSVAEIKPHAAQSDRSIRLRTAPSLLFHAAPSLGEPTHHPCPPTGPSPSYYPSSQPPYDKPRRKHDDRWPVSPFTSVDPVVESTFRRPSHMSVQSPPHGLPQKNSLGMRLSFDPSVAYSDSQANIPSVRQEAIHSLYTSAVSSQLPLDYSTTYGLRQPYVSTRTAPRSNETPHWDNTDRQSLRSVSSRPSDVSLASSRTSLYSSRPKTSAGYEQRWAASETDVARDIYLH